MNKTIHSILTSIFGLVALVVVAVHLVHWWTMHNTIQQWNAALTERVMADARQDKIREELHTLRAKLTDCQVTLAYKKGDTDLERRIARQVADLEAEDRARAEIRSARATVQKLPISKAIYVIMRYFDNVAHFPESVEVQEWGELTQAIDGTYLLPCRWSWKSRMGVKVFERKIFRLSPKGNILELIDF